MKSSKEGNWLTLKQAAQLTGYAESSIRRWIKEGRLPKSAVRKEPIPSGVRYWVKAESVQALAEPQRARAGKALTAELASLERVLNWSEEQATSVAAQIEQVPDIGPAAEVIAMLRAVANGVVQDGLPVKLTVAEWYYLEALVRHRDASVLVHIDLPGAVPGLPNADGQPVAQVIKYLCERHPAQRYEVRPRRLLPPEEACMVPPRQFPLSFTWGDYKRTGGLLKVLIAAAYGLVLAIGLDREVVLARCNACKKHFVVDSRVRAGRRRKRCPYCDGKTGAA